MSGNVNIRSAPVNEHIQINVLRYILLKDDRQSTEKLKLAFISDLTHQTEDSFLEPINILHYND